jgi:hypothetical protein
LRNNLRSTSVEKLVHIFGNSNPLKNSGYDIDREIIKDGEDDELDGDDVELFI